MSINISSSSFPSSNGGGGVQTSQYTGGTVYGQGYALIFPATATLGYTSSGSIKTPAGQDQTATISVTIDGISASYIGYKVFQGSTTTYHAWAGLSQGGPETFMFTTSFYATGNFQKIIIYLYT